MISVYWPLLLLATLAVGYFFGSMRQLTVQQDEPEGIKIAELCQWFQLHDIAVSLNVWSIRHDRREVKGYAYLRLPLHVSKRRVSHIDDGRWMVQYDDQGEEITLLIDQTELYRGYTVTELFDVIV